MLDWVLVTLAASALIYFGVGAALAVLVYRLNEGALPWSGAVRAVWGWPAWLLAAVRLGSSVGALGAEAFKMTLINVRVIDGDTLSADVIFESETRCRMPYGIDAPGPSIALINQRIRLLDFDAYEMREAGGPEAKAALEKLLSLAAEPPRLNPRGPGKKDSFGRLLGDVTIYTKNDAFDVAGTLAKNGHGKSTRHK